MSTLLLLPLLPSHFHVGMNIPTDAGDAPGHSDSGDLCPAELVPWQEFRLAGRLILGTWSQLGRGHRAWAPPANGNTGHFPLCLLTEELGIWAVSECSSYLGSVTCQLEALAVLQTLSSNV